MNFKGLVSRVACATAIVSSIAGSLLGQSVVINEIVKEVRTPTTASVNPDAREFIELYNPTNAPIDISGWAIQITDLNTAGTSGYFLPASQSIPANGYYVIAALGGSITGANFYATPLVPEPSSGSANSLFVDVNGLAISLRDTGFAVIDAIATDTFPTATVTNKVGNIPIDELPLTGAGYWGQNYSINRTNPVDNLSYARWRNGLRTNSTGRDFGHVPATPGASNHVPISQALVVPDVDALAHDTVLPQFNFSFVGARAIDPAVSSAAGSNPTPGGIPASPQGGKVIVAWDETGGGNAIYSRDIVRSFDIDVYFDATPIAHPVTDDQEWEHTVYGIGTTDALFGTPNALGTIDATGTPVPAAATRTQNASSGIGWLYERHEGVGGASPTATLALVDFGDGGQALPGAVGDPAQGNGWEVIQEISLNPGDTGWHRLAMDYDPVTGDVEAIFGDDVYSFTTDINLYGTFFVGYREGLGTDDGLAAPPIFDIRATAAVDNADFDADGDVDGADFLTWQRGVGINDGTANLDDGDANDDGNVTAADLDIWKNQFSASTAAAAAVPEPGTIALAVLAIAGVIGARRRRGNC
jgi:hypothetical protein